MKAALLVGINSYRSAPLRGCVPDIRAVHKLLTEHLDVNSNLIHTLLDRDASRANILRGLQWLASKGATTCYFFFSGHGARVPDQNGDERRQGSGTTYDQAIVPVDYERNGLILDDELAEIYGTFPEASKLIVHFDSCFSAKSDRGAFAWAQSQIRRLAQRRTDRALPVRELKPRVVGMTQERKPKGYIPRRKILLLSGCRDFETSADAYLAGGYRGAMTYTVEESIKSLGWMVDYNTIFEEARRRLAASGFSQVPQVEGPSAWARMPIYS